VEKIKIYYIITFFAFLIPGVENNYNIPTGEDYILGEDGIKRIYVNIWGHVKNPGTYLVYQDIDIATLLSMAGGPLEGAELSSIEIISEYKDNRIERVDLNSMLLSSQSKSIKFYPYDTIRVNPSIGFYVRDNASLINVLLQLITLGVALDN
tara:strand:- start:12763 stop:13218 length:456 start_codon:yes stop_codon:yes gene_type:complete